MPAQNQIRPDLKPVRFDPALERLEPNESKTSSEINATLRSIIEKTFADSARAFRSVHAKSHALLQGQLEVLPGLDETLAQGLFSKPATYPVVIRISTSPGDILPDDVSVPRGLALKVIGIEGEAGSVFSSSTTQDFVMVNGPAFLAPTAKHFQKVSGCWPIPPTPRQALMKFYRVRCAAWRKSSNSLAIKVQHY